MVDDGSCTEGNNSQRDAEEDDFTLDTQHETELIEHWQTKQRDVVSSAIDYNLESLIRLIHLAEIDLFPTYQRRNRWSIYQQSRLIESFLMFIPVPPVVLNEESYGHYSVVDGKQRLEAIFRFFSGEFALDGLRVYRELNGLRFSQLPSTLQSTLETRAHLRAVIIMAKSDAWIKYEVFFRLNTGVSPLNRQEIRNGSWPGKLNDMILDESTSNLFHRALGITDRERSAIYREMRDAELVLRFLTFRDSWQEFSGGVGQSLDLFMATNFDASYDDVERMRGEFREAVEKCVSSFGDHVFRRWTPSRNSWHGIVSAAVFDAEIFGLLPFNASDLRANSGALIDGLQDLFKDDAFSMATTSATNSPTLFKRRIQMVRSMAEETLR